MKRKTGVNNNDRDSSIVTDSITGQTVSDGDKAWVEEDRLIVLLLVTASKKGEEDTICYPRTFKLQLAYT